MKQVSNHPIDDQIDRIHSICEADVAELNIKEREYGGSWKKRGGVGAFMMLARKWDRIEQQVSQHESQYNIFSVGVDDSREEGILDDIGDLRRYLLLVEDEIRRQKAV